MRECNVPVSNRVEQPTTSTGQPYWRSECGRATVYVGDNIDVMPQMDANLFHAIVTDPPYGLEFDVGNVQGDWDAPWKHTQAKSRRSSEMSDPIKAKYLQHNVEYVRDGLMFQAWFMDRAEEMLRVAKPGAHLLSFGGTRMWHRTWCACEDVGWDVRDCLMWLYSSGFPKGRDLSKDIDKILGFERDVVGTAEMYDTTRIRPGFTGHSFNGSELAGVMRTVDLTEPKTEAAKQWSGWNTTLKPGWEPIMVARKGPTGSVAQNTLDHGCGGLNVDACRYNERNLWPANLIHDGIEELNRWFYAAKSHADMEANRPHGNNTETQHPTVKPLDLMRYLVRLACARGGTILDPFAGSFSTGVAAIMEGMRFVGIEQSVKYADVGVGRMKLALAGKPVDETPNSPSSIKRARAVYVPPPSSRLRGT